MEVFKGIMIAVGVVVTLIILGVTVLCLIKYIDDKKSEKRQKYYSEDLKRFGSFLHSYHYWLSSPERHDFGILIERIASDLMNGSQLSGDRLRDHVDNILKNRTNE